jgi:hypothetical protein
MLRTLWDNGWCDKTSFADRDLTWTPRYRTPSGTLLEWSGQGGGGGPPPAETLERATAAARRETAGGTAA